MPEDIVFDPTNKGTLWPNTSVGSDTIIINKNRLLIDIARSINSR
jgi:hypothetical protein